MDVSRVIDMDRIFYSAEVANPDVSNWQLPNITTLYYAFRGTALSVENYSAFLENLASQPELPSGITLSTGPQYNASAQTARDYLVNDLGWSIFDGGVAP